MNPGSSAGPGKYEETRTFNAGVKPITIGLKRKPAQSNVKLGPGFYKPENADPVTKIKNRSVKFNKALARPYIMNSGK